MRRRLRLLPAVIFVAALTLTLRLGAIWTDAEIVVASSTAAEAETAADTPAPASEAETPDMAQAGATEGGDADAAEPDNAGFDPAHATEEELELLQKLAERRDMLDARERDLQMREGLLKATEKRLDTKLEELKKIQATIDGLLKQHDEQQEAKMRSLVKIYENMKPKDAARIFERLDLDILLDVVERMREQKSAKIIADMDPAKAEKVTAEMAQRRALPAKVEFEKTR